MPGLASGPLPNAVNSSVVPTEFAAEPTTEEVLEGKFVTWTFRLPPKRQLSIILNFFFPLIPLIKLFLTFVVSAKTPVAMRFRAKNAGYSTGLGLSQVCTTSYWWPLWCGRTDVWTVMWLLCHYQKFLGLKRYPICLAMVLRWRATRAGSANKLCRLTTILSLIILHFWWQN